MESEINVCFNKFSEHFHQLFKELYEEEKYHDVTLVSDDQKQFRVHRFVLSAFSPVLKKLIDTNQNQNLLIFLRGIQQDELKSILEFMYLGEAKFSLDKMSRFIDVAKDLEVMEIADGLELNKGDFEKDVKEEVVQSEDLEETIEMHQTETKEKTLAESSEDPKDAKLELDKTGEDKDQTARHKKTSLRFSCEECDFEAKRPDHLRIHRQRDHEGIRHNCLQCLKSFPSRQGVWQHVKTVHERVQYHCDRDQCSYSSTRKDRRDHHIEKVHSEGALEEKKQKMSKPPVPCPACDRVFDSKLAMKYHYRSKHEGVRYPCHLCDYKATQIGSLRKHINVIHEGVRHQCNLCKHKSHTKTALRMHVESVHEKVRYYCDQEDCDFSATNKHDVKIHVKTTHEGLRYPCKHCDYEAKLIGNLKAHIRIKHDLIRYYCDQCDFKATRKDYLRTHMKSQHEDPSV